MAIVFLFDADHLILWLCLHKDMRVFTSNKVTFKFLFSEGSNKAESLNYNYSSFSIYVICKYKQANKLLTLLTSDENMKAWDAYVMYIKYIIYSLIYKYA